MEPTHKRAWTGAFIGEREYWGKEYGTDANMALLGYIFWTTNLDFVWAAINADIVCYNRNTLFEIIMCAVYEAV